MERAAPSFGLKLDVNWMLQRLGEMHEGYWRPDSCLKLEGCLGVSDEFPSFFRDSCCIIRRSAPREYPAIRFQSHVSRISTMILPPQLRRVSKRYPRRYIPSIQPASGRISMLTPDLGGVSHRSDCLNVRPRVVHMLKNVGPPHNLKSQILT